MRKHFAKILSYTIFVCVLLGYVVYEHGPQRHLLELPPPDLFYNFNDEEPIDKDQTCRFPILDPYDKSIIAYISNPNLIVCRVRQEEITFVDENGHMRLNKTALRVSGYMRHTLWCYYQVVARANNSDEDIEYGPAKVVVDGEKIIDEFISVWCKNYFGITVYSNMHAYVIPATKVSKARDAPQRKQYDRVIWNPNVLIFVLDSMSRLNFIRQLPRTYSQLVRTMGSVVLRGFTKVGDNTFPNLVPLLTGLRPEVDLPLLSPGETFDNWPCLWKNFSHQGYVTMLAEDAPHLALFNYKKAGFREQPTDHHYLRPFWLALDSSIEHKLSSNLCYGAIPKHLHQLSYVSQFVRKYRSVPSLGISLMTELSHDYLNQVGAADADLASFFHSLHSGGHLNRTVLIVMGDHGFRFGSIRMTTVGRIEDKMPFASVFIPPEMFSRSPNAIDNLRLNSKRLTSSFDLHHTIMNLLASSIAEKNISDEVEKNDKRYGMSVFDGEVPAKRTCEEAGIPDEFCTCDYEKVLVLGNPLVAVAARALVQTLNEKTQEYRTFCSLLKLQRVREAAVVVPDSSYNLSASSDTDVRNKIRVTTEVEPSGGLFEGTVVIGETDTQVLPDISRLNLYGQQAYCLAQDILSKNPDLRKFCYCSTS